MFFATQSTVVFIENQIQITVSYMHKQHFLFLVFKVTHDYYKINTSVLPALALILQTNILCQF